MGVGSSGEEASGGSGIDAVGSGMGSGSGMTELERVYRG